MIIRRYQKHEIPAMIDLLKEGLDRFHYGNIQYSRQKVEDLLVGNIRNPQFFCHVIVEDDGVVAGALAAEIVEYSFSYEAFAQPRITYIREGHSSLKGITGLVAAYKQWAIKMGAREIMMSQSTGFKMDKFAKFMQRQGFSQLGTMWMMENSK